MFVNVLDLLSTNTLKKVRIHIVFCSFFNVEIILIYCKFCDFYSDQSFYTVYDAIGGTELIKKPCLLHARRKNYSIRPYRRDL